MKERRSGEGEPESEMAWRTTKKCRGGESEPNQRWPKRRRRSVGVERRSLVAAVCNALCRSAFEFAVLDILRVPLLLPVVKVNGRLGFKVSG